MKLGFNLGYLVYTTRIGLRFHNSALRATKGHKHSHIDKIHFTNEREIAEVIPVPMLKDNLSYLIVDKKTKTAAAVDPCDPDALMEEVVSRGVTLSHLLITHKHWDHAGGVPKLHELAKQQQRTLQIVSGYHEPVPLSNRKVRAGDKIYLTPDTIFEVIESPCHTSGHIMFKCDKALFSGDTLFAAGVGKFFEGSAEQMYENLTKIASLPDDTLVFPGHEYTVSNLDFACWLEPDNDQASSKYHWTHERRKARLLTIPTTIGEEKQYNPFLRTKSPIIREKVISTFQLTDSLIPPTRVLELIRLMKDQQRNKIDKESASKSNVA